MSTVAEFEGCSFLNKPAVDRKFDASNPALSSMISNLRKLVKEQIAVTEGTVLQDQDLLNVYREACIFDNPQLTFIELLEEDLAIRHSNLFPDQSASPDLGGWEPESEPEPLLETPPPRELPGLTEHESIACRAAVEAVLDTLLHGDPAVPINMDFAEMHLRGAISVLIIASRPK